MPICPGHSFFGPAPGCGACTDFFGVSPTLNQLLALDFRATVPQPKYTLATWPASVPLPTRVYQLTEAAVPFADGADGTQNFTQIASPGSLRVQRAMLGLSADGIAMQSYTGLEFVGASLTNASPARIEVAGNTYLDVGVAGSGTVVAVGVLFRVGIVPLTNACIVGKRDAGTTVGWTLGINNNRLRFVADDGPTLSSLLTAAANPYGNGCWYFAVGRVRRQGAPNDLSEIITPFEHVTADIAALGTLSNVQEFYLGGVSGLQTAPNTLQVALLVVWESANAAALTQAHVQTLFRHGMDPSVPGLTTFTRAGVACDPIGTEVGFGAWLGCFSGTSGSGRNAQMDLGWKNAFSHSSKLGMRTTEAITNLITDSDDFTVAAWVKTNVTVSILLADVGDSPYKFLNADRLTAGLVGGSVQHDVATVAATEYTQSVYLRSVAGNINATLVQRNVTGGVDNASVAIVITTAWQRFDLTATTAVGQVATGFRLDLPANTAVWAVLANIYTGQPGQLVQSRGGATTMPRTNAQLAGAAGQYVRAKRGRMRAIYACDSPTDPAIRTPLSAGLTGAAANDDRRDLYVAAAAGVIHGVSYSAAAAVASDIAALNNDASIEHDVTYEWDAEHLLGGLGVHDRLVDNGPQFLGSAAGWLAVNTGTTIYVGNAKAAAGTNALEGLLAYAEIYG